MSKIGDAFQDWLDGGRDSAENQADRVNPDDGKKEN